MYAAPGTVYVYFTYGQHHMLNLVVEPQGLASAVLIRAIAPAEGLETIRARRHGVPDRSLADGPGKVAEALGLTLEDNGRRLGEGSLAVLDGPAPAEPVVVSGRIGLTEGHELPLRFYLGGHPGVSRGRTGPRKGDVWPATSRQRVRGRSTKDPDARRTT